MTIFHVETSDIPEPVKTVLTLTMAGMAHLIGELDIIPDLHLLLAFVKGCCYIGSAGVAVITIYDWLKNKMNKKQNNN